ncbi:Hsp70 family protein [Lujinxingia vulgaris]|uniref:Hsp70 family protein n=1 Tax=Lujinxingia vulgaris TaxID=2600176 RepID=A0A5C6X9N1_9DELT|nr:Hsp70 family protein [Lujinxingia vulgaris]TXD38602.1 Hsp70 family protein [Lujinxingia vulgaris]
MKLTPPFGIDLGTTHSSAAIYLPGAAAPLTFDDGQGSQVMPSAVGLSPAGDLVAGRPAFDTRFGPTPPLTSFKRRMGHSDALQLGSRALTPVEASGHLLSALVARFAGQLQGHVEAAELRLERALITIPAYFDVTQAEATRQAGELAGLEVIGLLQEPTAAAMFYSWKHQLQDGNFLVYDLGGGTFDVSVIRCLAGEYQVLGIDGDNHLGGDDFDRRLAGLLRSRLNAAGYALGTSFDEPDDRLRFELLTRHARTLKELLSAQDAASLELDGSFSDREGRPVHASVEVSRAEFERAIDDLIESTLGACQRALHQSGEQAQVTLSDIDHVLLVGGSTHVPAVQQAIARAFCGEGVSRAEAPLSDSPEMCVALGAALHAATLGRLRIEADSGVAIELDDIPSGLGEALSGRVELARQGQQPEALELREASQTLARTALRATDAPGVWNFFVANLPEGVSERPSATLVDSAGVPLGSVPLWLPRRAPSERPAPMPALSNPAVLSRGIFLEVVKDGKPSRHALIPRGAHLPTRATHRLATADTSGAVVLQLFQDRLPIHTLVMPLPEHTAPGTPLTLELDVDETLMMSARGNIGSQEFWVRIDPPRTPAELDWPQIEELMRRAEAAGRQLWGMEARRFERDVAPLIAGMEVAVHQDPLRLQILARRLEALLDEFAPRAERIPGRGRVDATLDGIRRAVFSSTGDVQSITREQWRARLDHLSAEVARVWEGSDDAAWRQLADRVQATYETVVQDEARFLRADPEGHARRMLDTCQSRQARVRMDLREFALSADADRRALQEREIERLEQRLRDEVIAPLDELRASLDATPLARRTDALEAIHVAIDHLELGLQRVRTLGLLKRQES